MNKTNIKQQLRRTFSALAISGALLTFPSADAAPPVAVSGSFDAIGVYNVRFVGPNEIDVFSSVVITFTGGLSGTWVGTERDVLAGSGTFHSSGIFTSDCGTMVMSFEGNFYIGQIHWVAEQGTGCLAGLHGNGTVSDVTVVTDPNCVENCVQTFSGNYSGQIQFAP